MGRVNRRIAGLAAVGVLTAAWGCGQGAPSVPTSTEEATVTGGVTIRGKPATTGEVIFDASNYRRKENVVRSAPIRKDGTYAIKTFVGGNRVQVNAPALATSRAGAPADLSFEVQSGENRFDIDVSPPAPQGARGGSR